MKYKTYSHNLAESIIEGKPEFKNVYNEIIEVIESITDKMIIDQYDTVKSIRGGAKSPSQAINQLIDKELIKKSWEPQSHIFLDPQYQREKKEKKGFRWYLDFAKEPFSIEVAFNHREATAHNLIKPLLASQLNHVEKKIQTEMGVIITATSELKKMGNFDGSIGTYELFVEYLKPYANILTVPIMIIGLRAFDTFKIDKQTRKVVKI
jgi:hypothetical protein